MTRRQLARIERRLLAELLAELDKRMLEQRRYIDRELNAIDQRIDGVLARSLRALNLKAGGRTQ